MKYLKTYEDRLRNYLVNNNLEVGDWVIVDSNFYDILDEYLSVTPGRLDYIDNRSA